METNGCGFQPDRRPAILFERHIFSKQTGGRFDAQHPDISNPTPGGYPFGAEEYPRLEAAILLDRVAALKSASWGIGQVMGFNFNLAGYSDVETMVQQAVASEDRQLEAMANFLKASGLAGAFQRFEQGPLPDLLVRTAQLLLTYAGLKAGPVDGVSGKMTRNAAQMFRQSRGSPACNLSRAHY